jgi:CheY-like chemotaxis protein
MKRAVSGGPLAFNKSRSKRVAESRKKAPVVLIVEDEMVIRLGAVKMAEDAGFEVLEAANADEAIEILESRNDIRLVFTDIHMPGSMDGLKLAHAVRDRWPPIKISDLRPRDAHERRSSGGRPLSCQAIQLSFDGRRITRIDALTSTCIDTPLEHSPRLACPLADPQPGGPLTSPVVAGPCGV